MKVFTKYLLTLLLLGIASVVNAQESEALFADGTYYLLNVGAGKYMAAGSSWGTHAVVNQKGLDYTITFNDGLYTIDSQVSNGGNNHFLNGEWNDGAAFGWTFTRDDQDTYTQFGIYTISNGEQFLTADGNDVVLMDDGTSDYARWQLVSAESRKNDVLAAMQKASVDNPIDISFLIKGADFNRNDLRNASWITSKSGGNMTIAGPGGNYANYGCEFWNNTFELYQTIEGLPSGVYELTFAGYGTNGTTVLFIDGTESAFMNTESASNFQAALEAIANGEYTGNTTGPVTFAGGNMTIGARRTYQVGADWTVLDNARLIYYGPASIDAYRTAWEQALNAATDALENEDYAVVDGVERTNLQDAVNQFSQVAETQEAYEEAASILLSLTNIFKAAAPSYLAFGDAQAQLAACQLMYPYASEEKLAAAMQVGLITIENAEHAEEMAARLMVLSRQVAESSALLEGVEGSRDLTELIQNPNAEDGTNGWDFILEDGTSGRVDIMSNEPLTDGSDNSDYRYFDGLNWSSDYWNGTLQQEITLPAGKYLLTVSGRASSDVMMSVFAGEDYEEEIFGEGNTGGLYGRGWNDVSVEFELDEESTINIGVRGEASTVHQWMSFTRFRLAQFESGDVNPAEMVAFDWVAGEQGYTNQEDLNDVAIALDAKTTMTCSKGTGSTTPKYYTNGSAVRTYGGNVITFNGEGITKIVITGVSGKVAELTPNTGELTTEGIVTTWKGEANEIVLTNDTKSQQHIAKLHVVYGGIEEDVEPVHIANTIDDPYTVAQAVELVDAGDALDETVFVKGIISQIDVVNEEKEFITYWISEDGTTEGLQFECYKGMTMEGLALTDIEVGAEVIVTGTMTKYNDIYEFAAGNALVSYLAPAKPLFADGTYYIYNIGTGKYLAAGSSWGTHAIVNEVGLDYGVKFEDGKYTLDSQISNGGDSHFLNGEWNDGAAMGWTFVAFDNAYYITDGTRFLTADEDGIVTLADSPSMASQWQLRTLDNRLAEFANASAENPVNATFLIPDANFGRNDLRKSAWLGDDFSVGGDATNMNAEKWGGNSQIFNIYQKLNVPDGLYRLTWNGYYRYNDTAENTNDVAAAAHADGSEVILSYVYMNDKDVALTSIADETAVNVLGMMPFSLGDASNAFGMGLYEKSANVIVSDGMLIIGIKKIDHIGTDWTVWDNFRLTYLGEPIDINPDDPELEAPEGWINLIANGNLASDDVSSFVSKEYPSADMIGARIVEGAGFNNSRGIVVRTPDETDVEDAQSWDSQFWINLSKALPEGTILHVEFDYKASQYAKATTQAHGLPGNYLHWAMMGDVNFATEWQHFSVDVEVSAAMAKGNSGNGSGEGLQSIAFNLAEEKTATDYFFDNFGIWAKLPEEIKGDWVDMLDNGDLEGDDNHNFYTSLYNRDMFNTNINDGDGVDGSRGLKIEVEERVEYDWDNRFYVYLNDKVPAGTKFRMTFDYRADIPASVATMAYAEPGDYNYWSLLGNLDFDTDWQTFEYEGTITSDISPDKKPFQSAGFLLSTYDAANNYYFDNFVFQVLKEHVDVIPSVTRTYPEASSFNVDGGTMEFHVNFDMPVDAEQIHATLDNEELTVIADGSIVWLARQGDVEDMTDGEHTIKLYSIYAEGWEDEDAYTNYEFSFVVGPINLDPEAKAEVILADNLWDATEEGGIPEGYVVNFNGEERTSESSYSSGARMFVFAEGGDFTHGLYFREGYTQYGGYEDYPLYLEAGKKYTINFKSAMWKDNGTTMNFQILSADEDYLVYEEVIKNNPNVNGSKAAVTDATNTTIAFTPQEDGNYILRWAVDGFNEVLLANPTVKYMTDDVNENVLAFFAALENAKQERDASADFMDNEEYGSLDYEINWAESEYQYFTNFNQFMEAAKELENVAYRMKEYRRLYQEYYPLAETMLALYQQYADTKFTQSYVYEVLGWIIDEYAPNGEILEQYNLYYLSSAYNSVKEIVTLAKDMFTEGPSRVTMTGYAVLKDRIRQGAETMRTLGIDNEDLLWDAENILEEEDWLVDEIKRSIKADIYSKLSKANNTLFDPIIDDETGEEVTPAYNMNIYVENPNIYKWGYSEKDNFSVPGWYVENANLSTGWTNYDSWDVPADAMFANWGNYFFVAQPIGDLPAGTYTVRFAVGERQEDTNADSYAYVFTSNEDYYAHVDYIGQTFPEFSVNNGIVTIENVVVTDGWMQIGVEAGSDSHLFFNEVQLLLTAPAPGYDYYDESEVLVGDVNLDGEVTTSDAVATVGIVLEDWEPTYRQFRAADVNYSYNITVSDVVGVVNIALNGYEWYRSLARSQSMEQEINYLTQDANKIGLNNTTEFVAFQMDVTLADGAMLNGVNLNQRANGLNIRYSHLEGNTYRIMAFSMNMAAITGNEGELLSFDITGNQTVTLSNIEFTDTAARAYALGVNDATGINGIMAGDANADYYTVDGVKNNKMRKGMNVVKTADGKVRKMFVK